MVAAGRLVGLARAGAASQPGSDGGRTDEQKKFPPLDRHPAHTTPRAAGPAVASRARVLFGGLRRGNVRNNSGRRICDVCRRSADTTEVQIMRARIRTVV